MSYVILYKYWHRCMYERRQEHFVLEQFPKPFVHGSLLVSNKKSREGLNDAFFLQALHSMGR
jgi:hypothetical protein